MTEELACPECGSSMTPDPKDDSYYLCEEWGHRVHGIPARHSEALLDLRESDDPALEKMADVLLNL